VVANDAGDTRTLTATVWRVDDGLLVFAERDHTGLPAPDPLTGLGNRKAWDQAVSSKRAPPLRAMREAPARFAHRPADITSIYPGRCRGRPLQLEGGSVES
jgi:hypothetical protein